MKNWILRFRRHLYTEGMTVQERVFRMITTLGVAVLLLMTLGMAFGVKSLAATAATLAVMVIFMLTQWFAYRFKKSKEGAVFIGVILTLSGVPVTIATGGPLGGGSPMWFLFCAVYICMVTEKLARGLMLLLAAATTVYCYFLAYYHPERIDVRETRSSLISSFFSVAVAGFLISMMILVQNRIYRSENRLAVQQRKKIEELNQAQSRFFSSMSHEIRTPINTIIGLNEMILRDTESKEIMEDAQNIEGASKMLLSLINDILDMSKMESGEMEIVPGAYSVEEMLNDVIHMIAVRTREKGLDLKVDVDPATPSVLFGDEVRIQQVLLNILNNAVKYTQEGEVEFGLQCKCSGEEARLIFTVRDTGMGIKKESIPYLFDAFKRVDLTKNKHIEGTGLGLSIVKQLLELMGGTVTVDSIYTKGTTFTVTLGQRIVDEKPIGNMSFESKKKLVSHNYNQMFEAPGAKVLAVDDDSTNLLVIQKLLRDTKVRVDIAKSGRECLEKTLEEHYDLILMDHQMPSMDGIETFHLLREQTGGMNRKTPVIALTANAGKENEILYRNEGFDGYLSKPVTGTKLEERVFEYLPKELVTISAVDGEDIDRQQFVVEHKSKTPILITTDSVSDIPIDTAKMLGIPMLPYTVETEEGKFLDGIETETRGVIGYIQDPAKKVKSRDPQVSDYENFFAEQLLNANYIIHIAIATGPANGYVRATEAASSFHNVTVIDSGTLSSGMGLLTAYARQLASMPGTTPEEVIAQIEEQKKKISSTFIVKSAEYLARTDRIPPFLYVLCRSFLWRPVLIMKNDHMRLHRIMTGEVKQCRMNYIRMMLRNPSEIDTRLICIAYAGLSRDEVQEVTEEITKRVSFERVIVEQLSPTLAINCGPGTIGMAFARK